MNVRNADEKNVDFQLEKNAEGEGGRIEKMIEVIPDATNFSTEDNHFKKPPKTASEAKSTTEMSKVRKKYNLRSEADVNIIKLRIPIAKWSRERKSEEQRNILLKSKIPIA